MRRSRCSCKHIRCIAFDVDGVLVEFESSWWRVHEALGTTKLAKLNHELYRRGRIGYWEWMYLDTLLWIEAKPAITRWELERILEPPRLSPRLRKLIAKLKRLGLRIILVSGGIDVLVARIAQALGVDAWDSPRLAFDPWGRLVPGGYPSVIAGRKSEALSRLLERIGATLEETIFIGDSVWDIDAMDKCCYSIAYNPRDSLVVESACSVATSLDELEAEIMILLGRRGMR